MLTALLVPVVCQARGGPAIPVDVPPEYRPLYALLARSLEITDRAIPSVAVMRTAPRGFPLSAPILPAAAELRGGA